MADNKSVKEPFVHLSKRSAIHPARAWAIRLAAILLGFLVCGGLAFLLIDKIRENPDKIGEFYNCFIRGSFSTSRKLWKYFKNLSILLCVSLAVTPAFRMKFWNIGAEGQTLVGVLGAIAVDFYLGGTIPEPLLIALMVLAAVLCGVIWGVIPALFKAKWNTNETLFTLMMNYIATYLVSYFLIVWVPSGSSTLNKMKFGIMPDIFGNSYGIVVLVGIILTAVMFVYLNFTKHGYEINVVGESVRTAQYIGIPVKKVIIRTMIFSGALCGLTGYLIAGIDLTVTTDSVAGQGFTAIMVSWLAKFNPIMMILTSALITMLNQGASQISQDFTISGDFPNVVVGLVLLFIIGCEFFLNYRVHFRGHEVKNTSVKEGVK